MFYSTSCLLKIKVKWHSCLIFGCFIASTVFFCNCHVIIRYMQYWKRLFASGLQLHELCNTQCTGVLVMCVLCYLVYILTIEWCGIFICCCLFIIVISYILRDMCLGLFTNKFLLILYFVVIQTELSATGCYHLPYLKTEKFVWPFRKKNW